MVKKALLIGALLIIGCIAVVRNGGFRSTGDKAIGRGTDQSIATAFQNHASNIQVAGEGIVIKLLADDLQKPAQAGQTRVGLTGVHSLSDRGQFLPVILLCIAFINRQKRE